MSIAYSASDGHFCNGSTAVVDTVNRNAAHGGESSQAITGLGRTESGLLRAAKVFSTEKEDHVF